MGLCTAFLKIKDRLNVPDDIKWHVAVQQINFNYAGFKLTSFNGYDPYVATFENTISEKTDVITLVGKMVERSIKEQVEVEDTNLFFMAFVRLRLKKTGIDY